MPKSKQFVESSDESSDSEPKSKKAGPKKTKREESSEEEAKQTKKPKKEAKKESGDSVWELGNNRQVTVREFKGKLFVDIREMYYDKDGDLKPGKKGICMNMAQWRKFMDVVTDVDEAVKAKC